ncbi:hypothetical protein ATH50_2052 [Haloplanus aerogenes]|uniref:DUF8071 domain-containing protein n=1 Tax=Haloplanus aerogenes TaxID=660522 RepID=A0A3M0DDA5_9EURY|nr:hypothetical protein ATH50_2052 [Haloplanus aerogenes]
MRPSNPVPAALRSSKSSLRWLRSAFRRLRQFLTSSVQRSRRWIVATVGWVVVVIGEPLARLVRGPAARLVRGPLKTLLLGRRLSVSVVLVALAPLLATLTAGVIASTTGYPPLERWLVETWTGTDPRTVVFVGGVLLVGLAAASAAANAGLLPTVVLVAGPLFGVAMTRYGTVVDRGFGPRVVSLPDATAFAVGVAVVGGVTAGLVGYGLGASLRRAVGVVRADAPIPHS